MLKDHSPITNHSFSAFDGLKLVTERAVIAALKPAFLALPLASLDQVFETPGTLHRLLTALRASLISLHAQLIFALP
jgi:hypothetical protein